MDFMNTLRTFTLSYDDDEDVESANVILIDRNINEIMGDETRNNNDSDAYFLVTSFPSSEVSDFILNLTSSTISAAVGNLSGSNFSTSKSSSESGYRDPLSIILPISICYILIFIAGVLGNVITCVVIATNKTMHTATNYYLFNLAVSDSLILLFGMPFDFISIWLPNSYPFDEIVCILQGLMSETSTNATILTITSFTCERYVAICHPFRSHTMSKLSRVIKFIFAIWILAFLLAAPQAFQFGLVHSGSFITCTVKNQFIEHAFEVSSFVFFIVPMTVICVLYILIGIKLRQSKLLYGKKVKSSDSQRYIKGQSRVVRMLIVVVVAFFLCWAPFHAQRIMAVYGKIMKKSFSNSKDDLFMSVYVTLTYISGISYFLSTCINPVLYNIMSHKFRNASKLTLFVHCFNRSPSPQKAAPTSSNYNSGLSLKYGVGEAHDNFDLDGVNKVPRKFFIFPKSKKHQQSGEIFQLKDERKEIEKVRSNFPDAVRQTYCLTEEWALEPFNHSCSQHTTDTIVHNQDDSLKVHPSSNGSNRQKCFSKKLRKVNDNGMQRGVNDDFRLESDSKYSKSLNGKKFKCPRRSSMATTTSLTSLSCNENDDDSDNVNNETKKITKISEASESSSFETEKLKTSNIPYNEDEDEF